jgi:hypothetical protein
VRRAVIVVFSLMALFIVACKEDVCKAMGATCTDKAPQPIKTNDPKPADQPRPEADPKEPYPGASGNVIHVVTLDCAWKGARWFIIVPYFNGQPQEVIERRYTEDKDPSATGGHWSETYTVDPGTVVAVECGPMLDQPTKGMVTCKILDFKTVVDIKVQQAGKVRCSAKIG